MVVSIELIGIQRDIARVDSIQMPITGKTTVHDALEYVRDKYPALTLDKGSIFVTVNHEVAPLERRLRAEDIICIIPYIGGG